MFSAYFQLCFAVLLAAVCHVHPLVPSHHNTLVHGLNDETRCWWNCTVIDSDLTEEIKSRIAESESFRLVVKYEKKVDNKCVNQTSGNSSGKGRIWLSNKQLSSSAGVLESLANLMSFADSNEGYNEIRAKCILKPAGPATATTGSKYNSGIQWPMFSQGHFSVLGADVNSTDCNTDDTGNSNSCIDTTNSTGNNSAYFPNPFERGGWPAAVFASFCFVFLPFFVYYSPTFLCLYSPIEVNEDGVWQITLEGASPVSFRSLIGNCFFSEDDGTIWHKAKKFCVRVVIMPLPFLGPAIFAYIKIFGSLIPNTLGQLILVLCCCYIIKAFYISFFMTRSVQAKPCIVCTIVKPKIFHCQDELPQLIASHLHLQPFILAKCWRLFIQYFSRYCKMSLIVLPFCKLSCVGVFRFLSFIIFLSTIPAVAIILLVSTLLLAFGGIVLSSPIVILCTTRETAINVPSFINRAIHYCFTVPATLGALCVLTFAGISIILAVLVGAILLFSEKCLPYVACFVLVLYYAWSNYSSFTNKYQDLAFALFKHYKKSQDQKLDNTVSNAKDQVQINIAAEYEDSSMKIPRELFHMACEELMPIRDSVCTLVLRVTIIVSFVFLVFSIAMWINAGATPFMRALLTFLTGIFPKIVAIYISGGRQREIKAMITDQRIPEILREYLKRSPRSSQGHDNHGTDVNETLLQSVNEEDIELIIM